ncbi:MAG: nucleotidyltransferase family protein [Alistipes sp.]|nr:nucleotidyltransferase family protein [Alistipes sp.]
MMNLIDSQGLLSLVRTAIDERTSTVIQANNINWPRIYKLAKKQGVVAVAWRGLEILHSKKMIGTDQLPDRGLKLQWALNAEHIEQRYSKQHKLASELTDIYTNKGIKTLVLKGLAISQYYPIPQHRECGDLDCFLVKADNSQKCGIALRDAALPVSCYNEGNTIAMEEGAKVELDFYKHSHINYKGLVVENHAFCTAVRGSRKLKAFERHLQTLLATRPTTHIGDSKLLCPCADFNALFLTVHSFQHFLTEGIKLRHVLDWALLLRAEQNNIDWESFYEWCDKMHYTKFADAMTAIAVDYIGVEISNKAIHTKSILRDRVLEDILFSNQAINNIKASKFTKRLMIIRNRMFGGWKYRELYEKSALWDTIQMVAAFFIERKPRI